MPKGRYWCQLCNHPFTAYTSTWGTPPKYCLSCLEFLTPDKPYHLKCKRCGNWFDSEYEDNTYCPDCEWELSF